MAEIKQQEQQIVDLLNEQRRQENELQRLHLLQQQRLEEQSNSFTHERKVGGTVVTHSGVCVRSLKKTHQLLINGVIFYSAQVLKLFWRVSGDIKGLVP